MRRRRRSIAREIGGELRKVQQANEAFEDLVWETTREELLDDAGEPRMPLSLAALAYHWLRIALVLLPAHALGRLLGWPPAAGRLRSDLYELRGLSREFVPLLRPWMRVLASWARAGALIVAHHALVWTVVAVGYAVVAVVAVVLVWAVFHLLFYWP
jgi:hypothetical protein